MAKTRKKPRRGSTHRADLMRRIAALHAKVALSKSLEARSELARRIETLTKQLMEI